MCYNVNQARRRAYEARKRGDYGLAESIERQYENITGRPLFHVSGFAHPQLYTFTNLNPGTVTELTWGLIPAWSKSLADAKKLWNQTLNARGETIFEKPVFKNSAKNKRCLIYVDAFYEHHHANGQTYPFMIYSPDRSPLVLAGLWEEWVDKTTGELLRTCAIVTTSGNDFMSRIHNNRKADMGPRMPVILPAEKQEEWLIDCKTENDKLHLQSLIRPYGGELKAHTVGKLVGKNAIPDGPEAMNEVIYPDLELVLE